MRQGGAKKKTRRCKKREKAVSHVRRISPHRSCSSSLENVVKNFITNRDVPNNGFPRAFLNWILLDEQFNYVPSGSGFIRVEGAGALVTLANSNIPITKSGYLFVFLSNESQNTDVYFDNLTIQHFTGPLLEETHYYPFGLTMAGISSKAAERVVLRRTSAVQYLFHALRYIKGPA
jgi:hypothetical protein